MKKIAQTPSGFVDVDVSQEELVELVKLGDRKAIGEVVKTKGGWEALTPVQKDAAIKLLLCIPATL